MSGVYADRLGSEKARAGNPGGRSEHGGSCPRRNIALRSDRSVGTGSRPRPAPGRRQTLTPPIDSPRLVDASPSSRDKILDTAEALFARRGFGSVGLREVALASGFSKSALFHHFPTKVDLYGAVIERILGDLLEAIRPVVSASDSPDVAALVRLRGFIAATVDALAALPTRAPLLLRSLFEGEVLDGCETPLADALLARILGAAKEILDAGVASGELRPVPVAHAMQGLVGMLVFHFASGEFGDEVLGAPVYSAAEIRRFKEFVISFVENGLVARS